jgi:putative tricarboxylic transport membrane protein
VVGLVLFVVLLNPAGFIAAGTVLFACTASAFGSRRTLRDAAVGFALCAAVYAAFTYALDVPLPEGGLIAALNSQLSTFNAER